MSATYQSYVSAACPAHNKKLGNQFSAVYPAYVRYMHRIYVSLHQPYVHRKLAGCKPYISRLSAVYQPSVSRGTAVCQPYISRMSDVCQPYIRRMSAIPNLAICLSAVYQPYLIFQFAYFTFIYFRSVPIIVPGSFDVTFRR